jgi:hypothetical protein
VLKGFKVIKLVATNVGDGYSCKIARKFHKLGFGFITKVLDSFGIKGYLTDSQF